MPANEVKKRRACNACTKAKAKCSSLGGSADVCDRCSRLKKDCVYGDSLRKHGPRTRSRMKKLEQRVESLMDLLVANGQAPDCMPVNHVGPEPAITSTSTANQPSGTHTSSSRRYETPDHSAHHQSDTEQSSYDPVQAGLLDEGEASQLLSDFRQNHANVFPFVLIDVNIDAAALRRQQPFLFLSIMGAMSHKKPYTQKLLADAFQEQIAARIVGCSHKGLEMLQGLLVHTAYYHFFYQPGKQQLALMVQLCVATAQDFGLPKKWRHSHSTCSTFERSRAGQRALLGVYYLAAAFAHAWRKRNTMHYTRALARSCQTFSQNPEHPSDVLIAPLIHTSELMCRINDYFSYDEIHDSEIRGETMIELSTSNFASELQRLRDGTPKTAENNMSVRLAFDMLDVLVHECSFHNTLWQVTGPTAMTISPMRAHLIQKSIKASQTLFNALLEAPSSALHLLAFPAWSNWFYSTLLIIKIVIFQRTGSSGTSCVHNTPHAIGDIIPQEYGESATSALCNFTESFSAANLRNKPMTAEESWLVSMFEAFIEKLDAAIPPCPEQSNDNTAKPFLKKVSTLQKGLLAGLKRITEQKEVSIAGMNTVTECRDQQDDSGQSSNALAIPQESGPQQYDLYNNNQAAEVNSSLMPQSELSDLDDLALSGDACMPPLPVDDWLWNLVMNDGNNMFAL